MRHLFGDNRTSKSHEIKAPYDYEQPQKWTERHYGQRIINWTEGIAHQSPSNDGSEHHGETHNGRIIGKSYLGCSTPYAWDLQNNQQTITST